jgi:lipoprotein-anchoring transpeptidase ErfK/SrfK
MVRSFRLLPSASHRFPALLAALCCSTVLGLAPAGAIASGGKQQPAQSTMSKAQAGAIDVDAFNNATDAPLLRKGSNGAAVVRAQILLDRAWYSSGEIDGRFGANMERMVRAYQGARGLQRTGTVTAQTWEALRQDQAPLLARYAVTEADVAGPYQRTPKDMGERSKMKAMVYESAVEALAERFHTSVDYLRRINGGGDLTVGRQLVVPGVGNTAPPAKAASIQIDKAARVLWVLDAERRPVAGFPISIGTERNDPLQIGVMAIKNEVKNPSFTYNPKILKTVSDDQPKVEIPPGPNNPVGTYWLGLTKPHWGIHGTPNPSNVGHSETNGCIHLTNWDVERLSMLAKAGFKVDVRP